MQGGFSLNLKSRETRCKMEGYIGNLLQLGGTRHYTLSDGKANGTRCVDVKTGSGFEFTVVCDRGMDLSLASYKGTNLTFLTANAEANPAFYNADGIEWLRTFTAGMMTTCGPTYLGNPCEDAGEKLGLHGRFSALPAQQVCDLTSFEDGNIEIIGTLYDAHTFGKKFRIRRRILSSFGSNSVIVEDMIRNEGGIAAPVNMLYHVNFGYPLLDETATIHVTSDHCAGCDDFSQAHLDERHSVTKPEIGKMEKNYQHTFAEDRETAVAWVWNKELDGGLAAYVKFSPKDLPYMNQWVLEDWKDYIVALEPANVPCESRNTLRQMGVLPILQPGETKVFRIEIGVISGNETIQTLLCD